MEKIVSAAEANRRFSEVLRGVREGDSYVVTSHGRPIAKITPIRHEDAFRDKAKEILLRRLRSQKAMNAGKWTRDELYEDE